MLCVLDIILSSYNYINLPKVFLEAALLSPSGVELDCLGQGLALANGDDISNLGIPEVEGQVYGHVLVLFSNMLYLLA